MPHYIVRVLMDGRARGIDVEASDAGHARTLASARGRVLDVRRSLRRPIGGPLRRSERQIVLTRLATMLESRVGLADALRRMAQSFGGRIRRASAGLADAVELGDDIATAMDRRPLDFPKSVVALVRAGGYGEGSASALRAAADFEAEMGRSRERFTTGVWIAVAHSILATAIVVGTARWLAPLLLDTELFREVRGAIDVRWVESVAEITTLLSIAFLAGVGVLAVVATFVRAVAPRATDGAIRRIPVYRDLVLGLDHHLGLGELAVLIEGGVPLDRALGLAAEGVRAGALRHDFRSAARLVGKGMPWTPGLHFLHPTDRAALAAAADRTELARALKALARGERERLLHAAAVAEPALRSISVVFLGIAGMVLFGLTILPVLQLSQHFVKEL